MTSNVSYFKLLLTEKITSSSGVTSIQISNCKFCADLVGFFMIHNLVQFGFKIMYPEISAIS